MAPKDITFGLSEICQADPNPNKVNMAIGIYATDDGKPFVLPIVRKVMSLVYYSNITVSFILAE